MVDFSAIAKNIKDLYNEKKVLFILVTVLVVLFFLGLIAFLTQSLSKEKNAVPIVAEQPLTCDQKLLLPEGPSVPQGYALTREPHEKWELNEAKEYFTIPDSNELQTLEKANNKLVDKILGDTP